jgi:hypothetical protein
MDDPEESAPQTLCDGRYIFKRFIKKGAQSSVFLYEDTTIKAPCIVKIEVTGGKNVMMISETMFLREA